MFLICLAWYKKEKQKKWQLQDFISGKAKISGGQEAETEARICFLQKTI